MENGIPAYLESTHRLLCNAFPNGVNEDEYVCVIALLYEHLSDRNLAVVVSNTFKKDYYDVLNDIAAVASSKRSAVGVDAVKAALNTAGFDSWLAEEPL